MSDAECLLCHGAVRVLHANDATPSISDPESLTPTLCPTCGGSGQDPRRMSAEALKRAYEQSGSEPGNPIADALAAEIKRRGLDV